MDVSKSRSVFMSEPVNFPVALSMRSRIILYVLNSSELWFRNK